MEEEAYSEVREKVSLKYGISSLETRLKTFCYPPNLKWGLIALCYLAVFEIWLPVAIIWKEAYCDVVKNITVFSFLLGIVGIFAYIVIQIGVLRRK